MLLTESQKLQQPTSKEVVCRIFYCYIRHNNANTTKLAPITILPLLLKKYSIAMKFLITSYGSLKVFSYFLCDSNIINSIRCITFYRIKMLLNSHTDICISKCNLCANINQTRQL